MPKIGYSANGFGKFCEVYEAVEVYRVVHLVAEYSLLTFDGI